MHGSIDVRTIGPNITGTCEADKLYFEYTPTGVFKTSDHGGGSYSGGSAPVYSYTFRFSASSDNIKYTDNGFVRPLSLNFEYIIKI